MERLGLGYQELERVNPSVILTSITPFGQTGPYRDYKASDIVGTAMGGLMYILEILTGSPLFISYPQLYPIASSEAAVARCLLFTTEVGVGKGNG